MVRDSCGKVVTSAISESLRLFVVVGDAAPAAVNSSTGMSSPFDKALNVSICGLRVLPKKIFRMASAPRPESSEARLADFPIAVSCASIARTKGVSTVAFCAFRAMRELSRTYK